jgi:myo-inositol-1(or 4)-monophosphatase
VLRHSQPHPRPGGRPPGLSHREKSEDNPVTLADLEADGAIRARLSEACADDDILSEEAASGSSRLANRRVWIVDPMDGTKEFTRRIPEFAVSVALTEGAEPPESRVRARICTPSLRGVVRKAG